MRFNGRLEQVLRTNRFNSVHDLETKLHRFAWLYNEHLLQRVLDLNTPIQTLQKWQATHPDLVSKRVVNHPLPGNSKGAIDPRDIRLRDVRMGIPSSTCCKQSVRNALDFRV